MHDSMALLQRRLCTDRPDIQVPRIATQVSRRDRQQAASVEALADSAQRSKQTHLDLGRLHQSVEQGKAKLRAGRRSTEPHSIQQATFGRHFSTDATRLSERINHAAAAWGGGATKLPEGKGGMPDPAVVLFCYNRWAAPSHSGERPDSDSGWKLWSDISMSHWGRAREASDVLGRGRRESSQLLQCPPKPGAMFVP